MNTVEPIRDERKINAIKDMLKGSGKYRDYLLFTLGINTALRISDLLRFKVDDLYKTDSGGQWVIRDRVYLRERKTGKENTLTLNESCLEALAYFASCIPTTFHGPVFFSHSRGKEYTLSRGQSWRLIRSWCRTVGLTSANYGTHTLRKTWGYHARKKGVPLEIIQAKLHHSSPKETLRYIGITADEVSEVEKRVNL